MSGGVVYVHDRDLRLTELLSDPLVAAERVQGLGPGELRTLLERHLRYTGSARAAALLARWETEAGWFWRLAPKADTVALEEPTVSAL
jgi:glutamate synthase (ferredoxin)